MISYKEFRRNITKINKRITSLNDMVFGGEKEFWEYESIRIALKQLVRVLSVFVFIAFVVFGFFFLVLLTKGVDFKGVAALVVAVIAGCFTLLSSIGNTENSVRSLRSKWLDDCRNNVAKYIASCRRYILVSTKCRVKRKQHERNRMAFEEGVGLGGTEFKSVQEEINNEINTLEKEIVEARMNFFEYYAELNVRFRSIKSGREVEVYQALRKHYRKYRVKCEEMNSHNNLEKTIDKKDCFKMDTELSDIFGDYFSKEWNRAKRGDETIVAKKNLIFSIILIVVIWSSFSWVYNEMTNNKKQDIEKLRVNSIGKVSTEG